MYIYIYIYINIYIFVFYFFLQPQAEAHLRLKSEIIYPLHSRIISIGKYNISPPFIYINDLIRYCTTIFVFPMSKFPNT